MTQILRPCIWCGKLGRGSRCDACENKYKAVRRQRMDSRPKKPRPHYQGDYKRRAKEVCAKAEACWICGDGKRDHDPWTADHVIPGDSNSLLLPAHKSCNSRRGNRIIGYV